MTRIAFEAAIADRTERLDAARQKGEGMIRNFQALATEQEVLEGEIHCLAQGFEWGLAAWDDAEKGRVEVLKAAQKEIEEEAARNGDALRAPCEHHYIGGNDGVWCTKCGEDQALTPPSQTPPPITETFAAEVARLNREIGARQSRLQFLICGDPKKSVHVPITPPSQGDADD